MAISWPKFGHKNGNIWCRQNWMTEAGIEVQLEQRLYSSHWVTSLGNNTWSVRIQYKPMIRFIWLGAMVMGLGGLIADNGSDVIVLTVPAKCEIDDFRRRRSQHNVDDSLLMRR